MINTDSSRESNEVLEEALNGVVAAWKVGMDSAGKSQIIRAKVPLAELNKYSTSLRSMTGGRGMHRQKFSHYEEVPVDIQQKLVEAYEAAKAEGSGS